LWQLKALNVMDLTLDLFLFYLTESFLKVVTQQLLTDFAVAAAANIMCIMN